MLSIKKTAKIERKINWKNILYQFLYIAFIFGFFIGFGMILSSIWLFETGFHNVDLSRNVLKISYMFDLNYSSFYDVTMERSTIDYDSAYSLGLLQMQVGLFLGIIGTFIFTMCLAGIFSYQEQKLPPL